MKNRIPNGLIKCEVCGEYNGQVWQGDVDGNELLNKTEKDINYRYLSVSCLCQGILCSKCKQNKINRPVSNSYDEERNKVLHWPWFTWMMGCKECREKGK
jgi:hypothetical protein